MTIVRTTVPRLRLRPPERWWTDLIAAAALLALMAVEYSWGPSADDGYRYGPMGLSPLFSSIPVLAVAVRRLAPMTALVAAAGAIVLPNLVHPTWILFWSGSMVTLFLLYTVARHRTLPLALVGCGLVLVAVVVQYVGPGHDPTPENPLIADVLFVLTFEIPAVAFGVALRRTAAQEQRLAAALAQLESDQTERERIAVLDVRRGLARDLHDVVAHAVSLMLVQAGAARLAIDDDPSAAARSLRAVSGAAADARTDLRALVGVLHSTGAATGAGGGLAELDDLLAEVRTAGLELDVRRSGGLPMLPPGLDRAAYRIVQEALTNVLKHAGPTRTLVELRFADPIRIAVVDDGPAATHEPPPSSGLGLTGIRERAALFGGSVTAGPRQGGGWSVEVLLPIPEEP